MHITRRIPLEMSQPSAQYSNKPTLTNPLINTKMNNLAKAIKSSYIKVKSNDDFNKYVSNNLKEYTVDSKLSDENSVVLKKDGSDEIVIAYRGTVHPWTNVHASARDYLADVDIVRGLTSVFETPRLREAEMKYLRAKSHYPSSKIIITGHSLGGLESYHVATKYDTEGHHFNAPILLSNPFKEHKNQYIYNAKSTRLPIVYGDPISEMSRFVNANKLIVKTDKLWTHGLDNFINEDITTVVPRAYKLDLVRNNIKPDFVDIRHKKKKKNILKE